MAAAACLTMGSCWQDDIPETGGPRHQVTDLKAVPGDEEVQLSWSVPEGWNPTEYIISYTKGTEQTIRTESQDYTVAELVNGDDYTFSVQAVYGDLISNPVEVSARPANSRIPVSDLKADAYDATVSLTWTCPSLLLTSYTLTWFMEGAETDVQKAEIEADKESYDVTGLTNDKNYTFTLVANYAKGPSDAARIKAMPTLAIPYTLDRTTAAINQPVRFTFNTEVRDLAVKAKITLSPYYEAGRDFKTAGAIVSPSWGMDDKGVIMLVADGIGRKAVASPILPGSGSSSFLFNVQVSRLETQVLSWYPSDADVRLDGETVRYVIPAEQNGSEVPVMWDVVSAKVNSYEGCRFNLKPAGCMVFVNVAMGNYDVASIELTANGGENLAGEVTADIAEGTFTANSASVKMTPATPVDCRSNSVFIPVYCAPVTLSKGFTAKITTSSGQTITAANHSEIVLEAGERISTEKLAEDESTELVFCGDNHVFVINAAVAKDSYKEGLVWSWDARTAASELGLAADRCDHLDECKFVDNGTKLLLTSSYGWCILLDYATSKVLFHATGLPNAHSAEYLPGGYIAVATSTGSTANHNKVHIYNSARSEVSLANADLYSGHGVVWDYKRNVLYAAGEMSSRYSGSTASAPTSLRSSSSRASRLLKTESTTSTVWTTTPSQWRAAGLTCSMSRPSSSRRCHCSQAPPL